MAAMARLDYQMVTLVAIWLAFVTPLAAQQDSAAVALGAKRFHAIEAVVIAGITLEVATHGFGRMSNLADRLEDRLPHTLHYNHVGDPVTWLHHAAWSAATVGVGALVAKAVGYDARHGARDAARGVLVYYVVRELLSALAEQPACRTAWRNHCDQPAYRHPGHSVHVGWAVDSLGDLLGTSAFMITLGR